MTPLHISYRDPNQLRPRANNPRIHSRRQLEKIADSIRQFGFITAVLIDGNDCIVAGHGRVEAAKAVGLAEIPTTLVDHLSPDDIRAYVIADNRLAELAGWDRSLLILELQELSISEDFDLTVTGFDTAEIDIMISASESTFERADEIQPIDRTEPPVSREGDLWQIGRHRLLCLSALDQSAYPILLGPAKAQVVFTDPPYNVRINQVSRQKNKSREFVMASGEMRGDEYRAFFAHGVQQSQSCERRRLNTLHMHRLAAHPRCPGCGRRHLHRAEKCLCVGEIECRHGELLSLATRACMRFQKRLRSAY